MKVSEKCGIVASKGNKIIGLILTYNEKKGNYTSVLNNS